MFLELRTRAPLVPQVHGAEVVRSDVDVLWVRLPAERLAVGRSPPEEGPSVQLALPSMSRVHLQIEPDGDGFVIADLGGVNGTWVNGEPVATQRLQDGDRIALGSPDSGATAIFRARA